MYKINTISLAHFLALALFLLNGMSSIATADEPTEKGSVESKRNTAKDVYIRVSHPDGLKKVTWYNVHPSKREGSKTFKGCPKTKEEINIGYKNDSGDLHKSHHHYVVIEPCKGDKESWIVTRYEYQRWLSGSFKQTGNIVEDKDSSMVMNVTDINLDGNPDIVVVDKSSSGDLNTTIMLGYGDGTFEKIPDPVDSFELPPHLPVPTGADFLQVVGD